MLVVSLITSSRYVFAPWEYALYYLKPLPKTLEAQTNEVTQQGIDGIIVYIQKAAEPADIYVNGWHNRAGNIWLENPATNMH